MNKNICLVCAIAIIFTLFNYDSPNYIYNLTTVGIVIILFFFTKEQINDLANIHFRPIHLFLISYCVVFFQIPIDYLCGYDYDYYATGNILDMPVCVSLASLGLISFLVGYFIKPYSSISANQFINYSKSAHPFAILTTVFIIVLLLTTPLSILMGGYSNDLLKAGGLYNYISAWLNLFVALFFVQHTLVHRNSSLVGCSIKDFIISVGKLQNINLLLITFVILNIGDRGPIIVFAISYYLSYIVVSRKSLSRKTTFVILFVSSTVFSFLGETKNQRDNNTIFDRIEAVLNDRSTTENKESISPLTQELATSYNCLSYSVMTVPEREDYYYGKHQLYYITSVIPFVSSFIKIGQPSSARLTEIIVGPDALFGTGTTILADFYLDFGIWGVLICMFVFGYYIRQFEYILFCNSSPTLFLYTIAFFISSHLFYIARSPVLTNLKYAIWGFGILYFYNKIHNKK